MEVGEDVVSTEEGEVDIILTLITTGTQRTVAVKRTVTITDMICMGEDTEEEVTMTTIVEEGEKSLVFCIFQLLLYWDFQLV